MNVTTDLINYLQSLSFSSCQIEFLYTFAELTCCAFCSFWASMVRWDCESCASCGLSCVCAHRLRRRPQRCVIDLGFRTTWTWTACAFCDLRRHHCGFCCSGSSPRPRSPTGGRRSSHVGRLSTFRSCPEKAIIT